MTHFIFYLFPIYLLSAYYVPCLPGISHLTGVELWAKHNIPTLSYGLPHGGENRQPTSDNSKCRRMMVVNVGRSNRGLWLHVGHTQGLSAQLSLKAEQESPRLGCE